MSRIVFFFIYLLHGLPLSVQAAIGNAVGGLLYALIGERREVIRINLQKCFPRMSAAQREALARAHFRVFCRSFIERGLLCWAPRARIELLVKLQGL